MTRPVPTGKQVVSKEKYFDLIKYTPHSKQWLFHKSDARFRIPVAGRRFGKTFMVAKDVEPMLLVPKKRIWLVGPTYDLGEKEFRVIWDDMIINLGFGKEKTVRRSFNKKGGDMHIEFPWQTRVEVRSADRPETLVGDGLDHVIMCEAAKHNKETWERFIRPALADRRGSATFGTTPEGQNWIYDMWQVGQNPTFHEYESWRMPSWENPEIYPLGRTDPEIQLLERTMSYEWFHQEIAADFTSFMGKIFSEWDDLTHMKKQEYNPNWPNYIAWDFGYVNPMAAIEFQVDPMDRVHIWREHYKSGTRLEVFIEELKMRPQPPGYAINLMFGDAADPEAVATICSRMGPCIARPESKTNWREGIDLVKSFLRTQQIGVADEYDTPLEEPWLFVDHSCKNTIREFNNYRAAEAGSGNKPRNPREDAQKHDDHAIDALRYALMHIFKLGVTMRLSDVIDVTTMTDLPETGYFNTEAMRF